MHRFERWRSAIQAAPHSEALAGVVRDYASCITAPELELLSQECRAVLSRAGEDIPASAVTLVQADLRFRGDETAASLLHELAQTFAAAATRHRHLVAASNEKAQAAPAT